MVKRGRGTPKSPTRRSARIRTLHEHNEESENARSQQPDEYRIEQVSTQSPLINQGSNSGNEASFEHLLERATHEDSSGRIIDPEQLEANGRTKEEIDKALNEKFPNMEGTFSQKAKQARMALAKLVNIQTGEIFEKYGTNPNMREIDQNKLSLIRDDIMSLLEEGKVFENFLYPAGKALTEEYTKGQRESNAPKRTKQPNVYNKAHQEGTRGNLSKSWGLLSGRPGPLNSDDLLNSDIAKYFPGPDREGLLQVWGYNESIDFGFVGPDSDDVKDIINGLGANKAPGYSGMTNLNFKTLIQNDDADTVSFITYLVNFILRGWISNDDWDLCNTTRGLAIPKGDSESWRPICISEPLMNIADIWFKKCAKSELVNLAGANPNGEHIQGGLLPDGISEISLSLQLLYEQDIANEMYDSVFMKLDISNAFNSLLRSVIVDMLKKANVGCLASFQNHQYTWDSKVIYTKTKNATMSRGVHQGRPSSPLVFDATLQAWLQENKILDDLPSCFLRYIHDDIVGRGKPSELLILYGRLKEVLKEAGLTLNPNKTQIFHHILPDNYQLVGITELSDALRDPSDENSITNITTEGIVFGGNPIGSDSFIRCFLVDKFASFTQELDYASGVGKRNERDAGLTYSLCRYCISTKWTHLLRVIPKRHWIQQPENSSPQADVNILKAIDDAVFKHLLDDLRVTHLRSQGEMTLKETENARAITFLRQADGGLGITSTENIADTAFVGTWTVTIQNVIKKQIMMATPELDSIRSITLIKDVTEATERIRNLIANDDSFRSSKDRQKLLGKTGTPNCLEDLLKRVSKDGGIDEIQHLSRDGYRHTQRRLSHAVSLMYANALAKRLRLQDTDNKGIYIQFEGQRQKLSMKGLNRAHLSPKARGLTNKQMRIDLAIALLVVLHPIRNCPLCGVTEVHFFQHCERCDKSNNSLNNIKKGYRRTYDTHKGLKREISYYTRFLPFISKGDHEPKPSDYFFSR